MQIGRRRRLKLYQSISLSPSVPMFKKLKHTVELGCNIMKWTEYCVDYTFMVKSELLIGSRDHITQ
jgi:hypothetical protein